MKYKEIVEKGLLHKAHWLHSGKFSDEDIEVIDRDGTIDFKGQWLDGIFRDGVIRNSSIFGGEIRRSQINKSTISSGNEIITKLHKCTILESNITEAMLNECVIIDSDIFSVTGNAEIKDSNFFGKEIDGSLSNCKIYSGILNGMIEHSTLLGGRLEDCIVSNSELREGVVSESCVLKNCEVVDTVIHKNAKKEKEV